MGIEKGKKQERSKPEKDENLKRNSTGSLNATS